MLETKRILLVDDEKNFVVTFSRLLEDYGYYTKTALRSNDALRLISEDKFDIVFLDMFLGSERGLDLMSRMSSVNPELYFVIITAHGTTDLAVESMKKGAADFLTKPFFGIDLLKSIDYVSKKRELDIQKKNMMLTLETTVNERTEEIKSTYLDVLSSLAQAMEKRDLGTYGHCKRVQQYCNLIASSITLKDEERDCLKKAAMLHDIGKIGISDSILGKPKGLTQVELYDVRSHPAKGVEILKPLKYLESALPAILHHHENYDGSGYPDRLSGENIPLLARIIAVADTYDAIVSSRPYRSASDHEKAIKELLDYSGRQFDPMVVNTFLETNIGGSQIFEPYMNPFYRTGS